MEEFVNQQNFYLGCRVCRQLLIKSNSIFFADQIPDMDGLTYSDAFIECTNLEISQSDELPKRLCSDCAAKLTISYQFRKQAVESDGLLKNYSDLEKKEENEMYENAKFQDEEMFEYETLEELEENSSDHLKKDIYQDELSEGGGNDAVSFLTGILKKAPDSTNRQHIEIKKIKSKPTDAGFEDPNRKHVCNVCHKKFQKRSNLIDHLRLHANVKVFSCEFCEKSFVQAGNFKAHLRTHTKEKPFTCPYCSKSYSQSSSLKIHIRSHTQEKNYVCDFCEKGFTNASDLGKHKLIHDPVKKYRCEECSRPFTQKIHLKKHLEKHHPDISFEIVMKNEKFKDEPKIIFEECLEETIEDDENAKEIEVMTA
ncbi:transcription factor Ouib-like [Chironomus tepperi]|uniref:transcription factor Ouib-like n=1 Tax=Chironomus tepperi TaxID=113505 RepID=UPI00391F7A8C